MKHGQVSLFIIIGLLFLILSVVLIYISESLRPETSQQEKEAQLIAMQKLPLRQYVQSCFESSAKEALITAGKQGLYIYASQAGSILNCTEKNCTDPAPIYIKEINASVPYLIKPEPTVMPPPKFPCKTTFCRYKYTPAAPNPQVVAASAILAFDHKKPNIIDALESHIAAKTEQCVEIRRLVNQAMIAAVEVLNKTPSTNITYSENELNIRLNFPLTLITESGRTETSIQLFHYTAPIRLKTLHSFIVDLLLRDTSRFDFDSEHAFRRLPHYREGISVAMERNKMPFDDLIIITDNKSTIDDQPYRIYVMRDNFPPLLNYIEGNFSSDDYDIIVFSNASLTISPESFDIDEDSVSYLYSGWKQQYDEIFDTKTGKVERIPIDPANTWHSSSPYKQTKRKAAIQLTLHDLGPHEFRVSASDNQFTDYQIIKVLVDDKLQVAAGSANIYEDIPNQHASIEDPHYFTAQSADYFNPGNILYTWKDNGIMFNTGDEQEAAAFYVPGNVNDYKNIYIEETKDGKFKRVGRHIITVIAKGITADTQQLPVQVHTCLPHRSNAPSYPYNNLVSPFDNYAGTTDDPFQGDHACCAGDPLDPNNDWTIKPKGEPCYSFTVYVSKDFNLQTLPQYFTGITAQHILEISSYIESFSAPHEENDWFKVRLIRGCSGTSGNRCDGPITLELDHLPCTYRSDQEEQCTGPQSILSAAPTCVDYKTGRSFEEIFKDGTGVCDSNYKTVDGKQCQRGCKRGSCTAPFNCIECSSFNYWLLEGTSLIDYTTKSIDCSTCSTTGCSTFFYSDNADNICTGTPVSLDSSLSACTSNNCGLTWFQNAQDPDRKCCGNSPGEIVKTGADGTSACCADATGCVKDGQCYPSDQGSFSCYAGQTYCKDGSWIDPDTLEDACTACGHPYLSWFEFPFTFRDECCGDDRTADHFCGGDDHSCYRGTYTNCVTAGETCSKSTKLCV